nr:peptide ABC transporter substrate-binding protein [Chloroflexota bacterium]
MNGDAAKDLGFEEGRFCRVLESDDLDRDMRWQAIIAILAILLILTLTGYTAFYMTTVVIPDYGGTYREGVAGNPGYISPLFSTYHDVDRDLVALIFNGLTRADENGQIQPDLADTWEISPDNLTYTFHLRQNVRWHDGTPFTADDVVFTINILRSPDFQGQPQIAELWQMVTVERSDRYTVRFTLSEPFAPFLHYTTIGLLPAHLLQDVPIKQLSSHPFNLHPIGTGPFKIGEVTSKHALLEANADYYAGRPYLDKIEFLFYPDYPSVLAAYQRGEIHGIGRVPLEYLPEVLAEDELQLYSAPLSGYGLVFLNLDRPVFQEKEVRQALLWALDRQRIIDQILDGQAVLAHGPVMPFSWAYEAHAPQYAYDPVKARNLLEKAGWIDADGDGVREKGDLRLEFALLTNDDETRIKIINEITRQWAEIGVRAVPQAVGVAGVVRDFLMPRNYDAILYEWQQLPTDPDPYPQWHSTQKLGMGQNFTGYSNEQADLLMEEARRTTDPVRRAALYRQLQRILAEDVPELPLYHPVYHYAVDKRVQNVRVGPMQDYADRFRTVAEWYINMRRVIVSEAPLWQRK